MPLILMCNQLTNIGFLFTSIFYVRIIPRYWQCIIPLTVCPIHGNICTLRIIWNNHNQFPMNNLNDMAALWVFLSYIINLLIWYEIVICITICDYDDRYNTNLWQIYTIAQPSFSSNLFWLGFTPTMWKNSSSSSSYRTMF